MNKANPSHYVCPMHPEVTSEKPGKCPKCKMDLVSVHGRSKGEHRQEHHDHGSMMSDPAAPRSFLKRFILATLLLVPLVFFSSLGMKMLGFSDFALRPYLELFLATAIFSLGLVFFQHAYHEIKMRQYGMMTLVSLGVGAGYLFSIFSFLSPSLEMDFYIETSTLIWVLLFGHYLEAKSSTAAGDALTEVAKLLPKNASLITKDGIKEVDISSLKVGDLILVKPGEKVAADGKIVSGEGSFQESHITGESTPVFKTKGSDVVAGSISIDSSVEVRLVRVGEASTIGQIKNLISQAKKTKPQIQKLADRASNWLTLSAVLVSVSSFLIWTLVIGEPVLFAVTISITVLVIACPHALGLAIPTVSAVATRLAVKNGLFIKDMSKIEVASKVDYVVFDKTGTLTKGEFGVTNVHAIDWEKNELLRILGAIEVHSSHVIGKAIVSFTKKNNLKLPKADNIKNVAGRGMEGVVGGKKYVVGNKKFMEEKEVWNNMFDKLISDYDRASTMVFVANEKRVLGAVFLSDQVKKEAKNAINDLHRLGVKVAMLTGDSKEVSEKVAKELRIDTFFAEVLPEDKYKYVENLQSKGNIVLMAGDGVNDAPALTQSNVGVAIGAGTEVAVEAGDVILTKSNPAHIVRLIVLSRKVYKKMIENIFWAAGYNALAIPAAAGIFIPFGFQLTPSIGAFLMSASSVIVVINAMSLRNASLIK